MPGYLMPKLLAVTNIEKYAFLMREQREAKQEKMKEYQAAARRLDNAHLTVWRYIKVDNEIRTPVTKDEFVAEVIWAAARSSAALAAGDLGGGPLKTENSPLSPPVSLFLGDFKVIWAAALSSATLAVGVGMPPALDLSHFPPLPISTSKATREEAEMESVPFKVSYVATLRPQSPRTSKKCFVDLGEECMPDLQQ
ncbi:hypothetical protein ZIOFF_059769 [Zingiber officinale]|uniref:Uncharacterized protein n=1 Tax=Zingiber officinale TaxID=94328 RepID=A0A8J5FLC1_ZINOF|nr:hypothetical protein ZIOFF_059769 [Zingiber officinale]